MLTADITKSRMTNTARHHFYLDNIFEQLMRYGFLIMGIAIVICIPVFHGIDRFYLSNLDPDLDFTYQALTLNAGEPLRIHPHTGYGYVLLLAQW